MSDQLKKIRDRIDEIDKAMMDLFSERMHLSDDIAEIKRAGNISLVDYKREEAIVQAIGEMVDRDLRGEAVTLMRSLMAMSKSRQRMQLYGTADEFHFPSPAAPREQGVSVAYQGRPGSWGEVATVKLFSGAELSPLESYEAVFDAIKDHKATYGVLPIENSSFGGVGEVYDLLRKYGCYIVGQTWVPAQYCLAAVPGTRLEDIREIYASDKALGHCAKFLRGRNWTIHSRRNFADSTGKLLMENSRDAAAIVSTRAAQVAGLTILSPEISSAPDDRTRYIVIADAPEYDEHSNMVTITFRTHDKSGALVDVLFPLMSEDVNMKRLESRPMSDGSYCFFCDLEGNIADENITLALQNAAARCGYMEVLGCYLYDMPIRQVN